MQQIYNWLKTQEELINRDFIFLETIQKISVNNNQLISSLINPTESTKFDGINRDDTIQVTLSFDTCSQNIYALKSTSVHGLLLDKNLFQQLGINTSVDKCIFILEDTNEQLSNKDILQKPVSKYLTNNNQSIRIRISISIQIIKPDDNQQLTIPVPDQNKTIEQILQSIDAANGIYKYLASNITKCILSNDECLSNIKETSFILVKENETCLVSIKKSQEERLIEIDDDEAIKDQQYITSATILDVYKRNKIDIEHKFLLYSDDFIPSHDILLNSFLTTSPIQFTLVENNLNINVTILNDNKSVNFHCLDTIKVKRLLQIGCQLFNINTTYYKLRCSDCLLDEDDDDMTLADIQSSNINDNSSTTHIELILVPGFTLNASIVYLNQTIIVPCEKSTQLLDITKEAFVKLQLSIDDIDNYEMVLLNDGGVNLENDATVEDLLEFLDENITTIPLELTKK